MGKVYLQIDRQLYKIKLHKIKLHMYKLLDTVRRNEFVSYSVFIFGFHCFDE